MDRKILIGGGVLALAAGTALWLGRGAFTDADKSDDTTARQGSRIEKAEKQKVGAKRIRPKRITGTRPNAQGSVSSAAPEAAAGDNDNTLSAEDEKTVDAIQAALDDEKFDAVSRLAASVQSNPSVEVRLKAVEALQWFGEKALPELVPYLADGDEEVHSAAMDAVEQALMQVEDEKAKARHIESLLMLNGVCSKDGITMLSGQLNALSDSAVAVATAVRIIESKSNPHAVDEMKEVYKFHTDEDYTTPKAAEKWYADKMADGSW